MPFAEPSPPRFTLQVSHLHWLGEDAPEADLCAHGTVELRIVDRVNRVTDLCVGTACVLLLRVLDCDHETGSNAKDALVPHCGHAFFVDDTGLWLNTNCNVGLDWSVQHHGGFVTLSIDRASVTVPRQQWIAAVTRFCDTVEEFYRQAAPKTPNAETLEGFTAFRREWRERRAAVQ